MPLNVTVLDSGTLVSVPFLEVNEPKITLAELAERSGIPARTIRFYIARGLLDGPVKAGRAAGYTRSHLHRLEQIQALQAKGCTLAEIGPLLGHKDRRAMRPPTQWWQHAVSEDVMVWTRADVSPWRLRQIRSAIEDLANRLAGKQEDNE